MTSAEAEAFFRSFVLNQMYEVSDEGKTLSIISDPCDFVADAV